MDVEEKKGEGSGWLMSSRLEQLAGWMVMPFIETGKSGRRINNRKIKNFVGLFMH